MKIRPPLSFVYAKRLSFLSAVLIAVIPGNLACGTQPPLATPHSTNIAASLTPERSQWLTEKINAFLAQPWSDAKDTQLAEFFAPLSENELVYISKMLEAVPTTQGIDPELRTLGRYWGSVNGSAAMNFLSALFPRDKTGLINPANATLQAWAAVDREACASYAHELGKTTKLPATWRTIALTATGAAFGMKDFAYAQAWAEQQGPLRHVAIRSVALSIGPAEYDTCAAWLAKLSRDEGEVYDALMDGFVFMYTESNPEKALRWMLHDLAPSDSRDISLKFGFRLLGTKAPDLAAHFFDQPDHKDALFRGRDLDEKEKAQLHDEFYMEYLDGLAHSMRIQEVPPLIARLSDRNNRWRMEESYYKIFERFLQVFPERAGGKAVNPGRAVDTN